jgi:protein gp37
MSKSSIEWTEETWNPSTGCDRISAGCDNCYALTMAKRLKAMGQEKYQTDGDPRTSGPGFGIAEHIESLHEPRSWKKPRTVFVNSMSDLFHPGVSVGFIGSVWDTMAATPQHTYQILTKRPARARTILNGWSNSNWTFRRSDMAWCGPLAGPLANVWLGTSIESAEHVGRAHHLRCTPATVRFVSAEPLLGPLPGLDLTGIDWLILGGESGPGARPVDLGWFRELIAMAESARTAVFVKQLGSVWAREQGQPVSRIDKKGGDWTFWPDDLRIREYPAVVVPS